MEPDWLFEDPFDEPFVRDSKPFRLLDLPAELWSNIGKMAIDEDADEYLRVFRCAKPFAEHYQHPITRVCHKLRDELLPYFYEAGFKLECSIRWPRDTHRVGALLKSLSVKHRRALSQVRVLNYAKSTSEKTSDRLRKYDGWDFAFELGEGYPWLSDPIHDEDGSYHEELRAYYAKFL